MAEPHIIVSDLTMAYGSFVVQRDLTFTVNRGDIFIIMGGSGCGKSTLLRHMVGLQRPAKGRVLYGDVSLWDLDPAEQERFMRRFGILYQKGALWSSMTLAENIGIPLEEYTDLNSSQIRALASLKLALVGLAGFEDYYPSEISGGMMKRAGLARAMALDPEILFFDEPSAGLDPISAALLDELILELRNSLGSTIVIVTQWVTITMVAPRLSRSSRISSSSRAALMGSSPADGSSKKSISGSSAMARAKPARFIMPPEISEG